MTTIGWYIHHHGGGHLSRFLAIRTHLDADVVCFSSLPEPAGLPLRTRWIALETDDTIEADEGAPPRDPRESTPTAAGVLHWAPLGHRGHARRLQRIATAIVDFGIRTVVVDVSVEVTLFVRLMGAVPIVVAQPGKRDDEPHRLAYRVAERIIAPWPSGLLGSAHLEAVRERVIYTGGISRHEGRGLDQGREKVGVLVLGGRGGTTSTIGSVVAAQTATPGIQWAALGLPSSSADTHATWVNDPWPAITRAEIVVSWAGQNSVADLAVAGARAVVIPQARPFDEQRATARALGAAGLATVTAKWPSPSDWPGLISLARSLNPTWERWQTRGAASRAAVAIEDVARGTG